MTDSMRKSTSKYTYLDVINFAKKYNCEILNYKNPLESTSNNLIIKCKCGHFTTETKNNFIKKKIGIYCKDCMEKITSNNTEIEFPCSNYKCKKLFVPNQKSFLFCSQYCSYSREKDEKTKIKISTKLKNNIKNVNNKQKSYDKNIYSNGNIYLNNLIGKTFNFEITNRCCHYNHIIKPIETNSSEDNQNEKNQQNEKDQQNHKIWLPVEIKYSNSSSDEYYYFTMRKNYKNILIICVSLEENKIWIFPPNSFEYTSKLKINKSKPNRFEKYTVEQQNIIDILLNYYNTYKEIMVGKNDNLIENMPETNPHIKVEYEYKKKRLHYINFIDFQNPISNFEPYNFIINGFKVQECVSFTSTSNQNQIVSIHKKQNGYSTPFYYKDSDFYWIHERNSDNFYLIPSTVMYDYDFLDSEFKKGKTTINLNTNQYWLFKYKFSYSKINQEPHKSTLLKVFGITQNEHIL